MSQLVTAMAHLEWVIWDTNQISIYKVKSPDKNIGVFYLLNLTLSIHKT